jgi:hypothetical protein
MKPACTSLFLVAFVCECAFSQIQTNYPWIYSVTNDEVTITRYIGPDGSVEFPSEIQGNPVRVITGSVISNTATSVFGTTGSSSTARSITHVQIPDSVTSIGEYAFHYLDITNVVVGKNVTNIGKSAFFACTKMVSAIIPPSVAFVGDLAFGRYLALDSVLFLGSPPSNAGRIFSGTSGAKPVVYFMSATNEWGPSFAGRPTAMFSPKLSENPVFTNGHFSFSWTGTGRIPINIQRSDSLDGAWTVMSSNNDQSTFTDTNTPTSRGFYRAALP